MCSLNWSATANRKFPSLLELACDRQPLSHGRASVFVPVEPITARQTGSDSTASDIPQIQNKHKVKEVK